MNLAIWAAYNVTLTTGAGTLAATVSANVGGVIQAGTAIKSTLVPPGTTAGVAAGTNVTLALPIITLWGFTRTGHAQVTELASTDWLLGATANGLGISGLTVTSIDQVAVPTAKPPIKGAITLSATPSAFDANFDNKIPIEFTPAASVIAAGADTAAVFTGASIVYNATLQLERSFDGGYTYVPCNIGGGGQLAQWNTGTDVSISWGEPERGVLYRLNALAYTGITNTTLNYRLSTTGQAALSISIPVL